MPSSSTSAALPVVLDVTDAAPWLQVLNRTRRMRLVAAVDPGASEIPGVPSFSDLQSAIQALPDAAFAACRGPRAGLDAALALAASGRSAVVCPPLHDRLADVGNLGTSPADVRIAHGWRTLRGARIVETLMRRQASGRLAIEIAGLPGTSSGDLAEVLVHAASLLRALLPQALPRAAERKENALVLVAESDTWRADLIVREHGDELRVRVDGADAGAALWRADHHRESVSIGRDTALAERPVAAVAARALAQLLPSALRGDDLTDAAGALRLARSFQRLLPAGLPPRRSLFVAPTPTQAGSLSHLGLRGDLPGVDRPARLPSPLDLPAQPFEIWAFRAGVKPVVFLTVAPHEVESTLAGIGDVACERRERKVEIASQDRWTDRRDRGEPRVELYLSKDPELARRAVRLQAEADPSRAAPELGELLGYPPCCVAAFVAQSDRANNSANRYESYSRTFAGDGTTSTPWPWQLNNLHTVVAPFYPCSYRCQHALQWVDRVLAEMTRTEPSAARRVREVLARPVLYFDHDHQLVFEGEFRDRTIHFESVAPTQTHAAPLAAAIARGSQVILDDEHLRVRDRGGSVLFELQRIDPGLGFVAPFA